MVSTPPPRRESIKRYYYEFPVVYYIFVYLNVYVFFHGIPRSDIAL